MKSPITKSALLAKNPCGEGAKFIAKHRTLKAAWNTCAQVDWMIWALNRFGLFDESTARTFACDCAEHTLHFFEEKYPDFGN